MPKSSINILTGILLATTFCIYAKPLEGGYPLKPLKECSPRKGLPNFFSKLKQGENVKIAFLGGSITAQKGWRIMITQWYRKHFPKVEITEINAGIRGTGSDLGAFRLSNDVLQYKPDLLFVEFATNDVKKDSNVIREAMEGIVRQTWNILPDCDICFIYTVTRWDIDILSKGKMRRSASIMEEVADYYGIPSIHFGKKVTDMVKNGSLIMKSGRENMKSVAGDCLNVKSQIPRDKKGRILFSKDGVHPYLDTGHLIYLKTIARNIPSLHAAKTDDQRTLKSPISPLCWDHTEIHPLNKAELKGFSKLNRDSPTMNKFARKIPTIWKGIPGATLKLTFKGTRIAFYDVIGPDSGLVQVTIDGKKRNLRRFDGYSINQRLSFFSVASGLKNIEHTITIKVLDDKLNKKKILFKHNRKIYDRYPSRFKANNWYAGEILVIGNL